MFCVLSSWSVRYPRVRAETPSKVQSTDGAKRREIPGQREKDETQNHETERKGAWSLGENLISLKVQGWEVRRE